MLKKIAYLLFVAMVASTTSAFAADNGSSNNNSNNGSRGMSDKELEMWERKCVDPDSKECKAFQNRYGSSASSEKFSCDAKNAEFTKKFGAFKSACSNAGYPKDPEGGKTCASGIRACNECGHGNSDDDDGDDDYDDSDPVGKALDCSKYGNRNLASSDPKIQKIGLCPELAGKGLKEHEKDVKAAEAEVEKLREKIPQIQKKIDDAEAELENKKAALKKEGDDIDIRYNEAIQKIEDETEQENKALIAEKRALVDKEDALSDEMHNQHRLSEEAYYTSYSKSVRAAKMQCHANALRQMAEIRAERRKQIENSSYTAGGFNDVVAQMGLNTMQRDKKMAYQFYRQCELDAGFTDIVHGGYQEYKLQKKRHNDKREQADRERKKARQDQNDILAQKIPAAARKALAKMDRIKEERRKQKRTLRENEERLTMQSLKNSNRMAQEMAEATKQLNQKQTYLAEKMAVFKAKEMASGGREVSESAISKLHDTKGEVQTAALDLTSGKDGNSCCTIFDKSCNLAREFLKEAGMMSPDDAIESNSRLNSAATTQAIAPDARFDRQHEPLFGFPGTNTPAPRYVPGRTEDRLPSNIGETGTSN